MPSRHRRLLLALLLPPLLPASLEAQGLAIDHKAIGCIVAGQYPKLNACFLPPASLARARIFFRASGTPHWYFVEMRTDTPCFTAVLPKPKPTVDNVDYYVEAVDKTFGESRTTEFKPEVVDSPGECRKDLLAAPFLRRASVVLGVLPGAPAIPPGFSAAGIAGAGISTGLVAAGVVGAGAAVAGAVAVAGGGDGSTTTIPGAPLPPTTVAPVTTTTTTTTTTLVGFNPTFSVNPDPPVGPEPLTVTFNMCGSSGQNLKFTYDFDANGVIDTKGFCRAGAVYTSSGFTLASVPLLAPPTTLTKDTCYRHCVTDNPGSPGQRQQCYEGCVRTTSGVRVDAIQSSEPARRLSWTSQLEVPEASGQVVVNGESAAFAAAGRSVAAVQGRRGDNRIEAQLVRAGGRPGTWRFELGTTASLEPGSLRVIAGEVALITDDAIVFRLTGRSGERVVFSFRTRR